MRRLLLGIVPIFFWLQAWSQHVQLDRFSTSSGPEAIDIASGRDGSIGMVVGVQYSTNTGRLVDFWDSNQNFLWGAYFPSYEVRSLAIHSDSAVWISGGASNGQWHSLEKRDQNGNAVFQFTITGGAITHMVTDTAGNLFAFNAGGLMKFSPQGNLIWGKSYSGISALTRLVYHHDLNTLSLISAGKAVMLDLNGNVLFSRNVSGGAVLLYSDYSMVVFDNVNYRLVHYDSSSNPRWSVAISGFPGAQLPATGKTAAAHGTGGVVVVYPRPEPISPWSCPSGPPFYYEDYGYLYLDSAGVEKAADKSRGLYDQTIAKVLKEDVNGDVVLGHSEYTSGFGSCLTQTPAIATGTRWVFQGSCQQDPPAHQLTSIPAFGSVQPLSVSSSPYTPVLTPFSIGASLFTSAPGMVGCCSKPRPEFTYLHQANTYQFTSSVFGHDSLWWDFGDSTTSSLPNPSHNFSSQADSFFVCLYSENSCGIDSSCEWVTFCNNVQFSVGSNQICLGDSLTMVNLSDPGQAFVWYDNGSAFSTATNPTWQPLSPGLHTILLEGDNGLCINRDSAQILVESLPPQAGFSYQNTNLSLVFTDSSAGASSWFWDFGDGATSTLQNPSHTYATSGSYPICQIAYNPCGSDTVCSSFSCNLPVADFSLSYQFEDSIALSNASSNAQSWFWNFGDGSVDSVQNPGHVYSQTGVYNLSLRVENACGVDSLQQTIYVFVPLSGNNTHFRKQIEFDSLSSTLHAIAETPDQGLVAVGRIENPGQAAVCKMDGFGNVQWTRRLSGNSPEAAATHVILTADQNYLVAGYRSAGVENTFLMKITPQGNLLWMRRYGSGGLEIPTAIAEVDSGHVVVCGYRGNEAWCMKTDSAGNVLWEKIIGKSGGSLAARHMVIDQDGDIILGMDWDASNQIIVFLMRLDQATGSELNSVWVQTSIATINLGGMTQLPGGELVLCVNEDASNYNSFPTGFVSPFFHKFVFPDSIPLQGGVQSIVRSYQANSPLWPYPNNSFYPYEVTDLIAMPNGRVLATGTLGKALNNNFGGLWGFDESVMLLRLEPDLSLDTAIHLGQPDDNAAESVFSTSCGDMVSVGKTRYFPPGSPFQKNRADLQKIAYHPAWNCGLQPYSDFLLYPFNGALGNAAVIGPAFNFSSGMVMDSSNFSLLPLTGSHNTACATTCNSSTTANFGTALSGYTATFSDSSTGANSWYWDFGDGSTSTLANPSHTYVPGTYQICLLVSGACCIDSFCQTITITQLAPQAGFTYSLNQQTATFQDASTGANSWFWDFGDGNTSTQQNPSHTYATCGTYNVCLIVSNTTASDTFCTTVTAILPPPVSAFSSQDSLLQVSFSDSSQNAVNWQWNFGDGNTDTVPNPSHTYLVSGSYLVCLVTENACGTRDTLCQTVVVNCPLPQPNFLSSTSQLNVSFLNLTPGTTGSSWDFGDGNTSTQQSPSHTYTACGTYNVCLMSSNSCGFDTTCRMVTIALPSPVAQYSSQNTALQVSFSDSSQNATSWLWSFGDGGTSNTQNPIHAYATCDSFQVCLISSNACASDTSCQTIDFRPAEPSITQFTDTLVSSTASTYQWYLNGVPQVGDTLPEFIPTTPGYYQVAIVDSNGCPSISDSLFVNPISTSIPAPQDAPQVFPNPTSGELIVAFPRISTGRVEVWSALGKMVMQRHTASQDRLRLDLSPLADGIYHLKIEFESRWTVYKIALQR